ncbi:hypothetical protein DPMN_130936 [Dreissena polymorpha]|uniref:Uncharacterized protein n=1 Tax=Dreissena polymorpha TaxID=45954 RepID=A0A9D4GLE0_DREPO|nr:hypothetical protein DPMN_119169 [Dreissena polymorpha]KAH3828949.1 hypothetical protein DPMN_130936 [Dreissena polymorpha]
MPTNDTSSRILQKTELPAIAHSQSQSKPLNREPSDNYAITVWCSPLSKAFRLETTKTDK